MAGASAGRERKEVHPVNDGRRMSTFSYIKRDKLLATLQYAAMIAASDSSSSLKKLIQTIASARKVFRLGRPIEELLAYSKPVNEPIAPLFSIIGRCAPFLNAVYFACDHVVLAKQAGFIGSSDVAVRAQKYSLLAWLIASVCSAVHTHATLKAMITRRPHEDAEQLKQRLKAEQNNLFQTKTRLAMLALQAVLAIALLRGSSGRFTGLLGVLASGLHVINI